MSGDLAYAGIAELAPRLATRALSPVDLCRALLTRCQQLGSPLNLVGLPALTVPCGFEARDGRALPIGLQLAGRAWEEGTLLGVAHAFQQATDWHRRRPPLAP